MHLPQARLDQLLDRFHQMEARMGAATDGVEIVKLAKEHAELKPVADAISNLMKARGERPELEEMARSGDAELKAKVAGAWGETRPWINETEREDLLKKVGAGGGHWV